MDDDDDDDDDDETWMMMMKRAIWQPFEISLSISLLSFSNWTPFHNTITNTEYLRHLRRQKTLSIVLDEFAHRQNCYDGRLLFGEIFPSWYDFQPTATASYNSTFQQ